MEHTIYCPECDSWVDKHDTHECDEADEAYSMLDFYNKKIVPLAQELPFFERIGEAPEECTVCSWHSDLTEIRYIEEPEDQSFYYPGNGVKALLCPVHLGKRIKRLDNEGTGYTLKPLAESEPYLTYMEVLKDEEL